jgi:hypothetical protein
MYTVCLLMPLLYNFHHILLAQILPFYISSILFILVPSSLYLVLIPHFSCVRFVEFYLNKSTV